MHSNGELNLPLIATLADRLIADGVSGFYVCGSTGEGPCLSSDERKSVLASYVKNAAGRVPVIAQVGHDSLTEAKALASHAESAGADAVSAVSPYYFKPESVSQLIRCISEIAAAAPSLPFYYYHIPRLTGINIDIIELNRMARESIPTFAGIKYSAMSLEELQVLTAEPARTNVLFGVDECLLSGMLAGADGAVGSTYNFATPIFKKVLNALKEGDLSRAQDAQLAATRLIRAILKYGAQPAIKSVMRLVGIDCGPSRLPLRSLTETQINELRNDLAVFDLLPLTANA